MTKFRGTKKKSLTGILSGFQSVIKELEVFLNTSDTRRDEIEKEKRLLVEEADGLLADTVQAASALVNIEGIIGETPTK